MSAGIQLDRRVKSESGGLTDDAQIIMAHNK